MSPSPWIHSFLADAHVPYTVLPHRPAFTADAEAAATHVPAEDWAKVVICVVDGEPLQAVVRASDVVDLDALLDLTGGLEIRLAEEDELRRLYYDCEPGAMPPFGPAYGQSVFVDAAVASLPRLTFNAGTHTDAISMRWSDFESTVHPVVAEFAAMPSMSEG